MENNILNDIWSTELDCTTVLALKTLSKKRSEQRKSQKIGMAVMCTNRWYT